MDKNRYLQIRTGKC